MCPPSPPLCPALSRKTPQLLLKLCVICKRGTLKIA